MLATVTLGKHCHNVRIDQGENISVPALPGKRTPRTALEVLQCATRNMSSIPSFEGAWAEVEVVENTTTFCGIYT